MSQVLAILPSQINNATLKRFVNNDSYLEYEIEQNTVCKDAFGWDLDASQIKQSALAEIVSIDYKKNMIILRYDKQQLLSQVDNPKEINCLYVIFQLLEACYELHKKSILGRCLSSSTIEIDQQSQIKIYRYGYSHNLLNNNEIILLAPETIFEDKVQISSDIWLIGMIIYQLVFKKSIVQFTYPKQYSQYKDFIRSQMEKANTFDDLFDNQVDPKISPILQLLLIFDAESRVQSYSLVILKLREYLPQYKGRLSEILKFYENEIDNINIKIIPRSEKRDPPKRQQQRNVKSKSLVNKQIDYEVVLHANRRINPQKKKQQLRYSYIQSVQPVDKIYTFKIVHQENIKEDNIAFCQNINFKLYSISFLINLREQISCFTKNTEYLNLDKQLLIKIDYIIDLLIDNNNKNKNILFISELNQIMRKLDKMKITYNDIKKKIYNNDKFPAQFFKTTLENEIQSLQQTLQNNLTKHIAIQIILRILIAQNIEYYLADKQSVNLFLFPMKFYLGVNEISEPEEIERYLQRSPINSQLYMLNLLKNYKKNQLFY